MQKEKILLIEDNKIIREKTAEILQLAQYLVVTAKDGREGVEMAQKEKPDLIICDIIMPNLDGYGVIHLLLRDEETARIPFIFLTGKSEHGDLRKGMNMGADDYLIKPFDNMELLNAIESRLKKKDILKKNFEKDIRGFNDFLKEIKEIDALNQLSEEFDIRIYKKKEDIYREGNYPRGIYFINKGKVKTFCTNEFGKELIIGLHKEGDFFGYTSLLQDEAYRDSAVVLEDADVYMIPKEVFFSLLYKNNEVSCKFIKILSDNVVDHEQHLITMAYNSVRKRVAHALIKIADTYKTEGDANFCVNFSRNDLANMVGTSRESLIRTLGDFKEEQLIETSGSTITIINYDELSKIKN